MAEGRLRRLRWHDWLLLFVLMALLMAYWPIIWIVMYILGYDPEKLDEKKETPRLPKGPYKPMTVEEYAKLREVGEQLKKRLMELPPPSHGLRPRD